MALILPTKSLALAAIVAWSGIAASVLTGQREAAPHAAPVSAQFQQRWSDVPADDQAVLKKQDRLPVPEPQKMRQAAPEPAAVDPKPLAKATPADEQQAAEEKRPRHVRHVEHEERHAERNVCTRHGMRKVITRHGKSWRCRK